MHPQWSSLVPYPLCNLSMAMRVGAIWVEVHRLEVEVRQAEVVGAISTMSTSPKKTSHCIWRVVRRGSQSRAEVSAGVEGWLLKDLSKSWWQRSVTTGEP